MKSIIIFSVLLVIGVVKIDAQKRGVLRRSTRQAVDDMTSSFLQQTQLNIINNCKKNGLSTDGALELQDSFTALTKCMNKHAMYSIPKNEYIDKMVSCSHDIIQKTKDCLRKDQQYFPDLLLDLAKSMVTYFYDDKDVITSFEVIFCLNHLTEFMTQLNYIQCLVKTSRETNDDENIPTSKADFCKKFIPAVDCFPNTLKGRCNSNKKVNQFLADYTGAIVSPCNTKEQDLDLPKLN